MDAIAADKVPAAFVRASVDPFDAVAVPLPSGAVVLIRPARLSASDYLAGRAPAYAVSAMRARDAWIRAERTKTQMDTMEIAGVVIDAIRNSYDAPQDVVDAWTDGLDAPAVHAIAAAAIGATPTASARARGRATALVAAGMGEIPLSPIDVAALADWSVNSGNAPAWGG